MTKYTDKTVKIVIKDLILTCDMIIKIIYIKMNNPCFMSYFSIVENFIKFNMSFMSNNDLISQ